MQRFVRCLLGLFLAAFIIGTPIWYARYWDKRIRNFRVVTDSVLYRSGQMTLPGLKQMIHCFAGVHRTGAFCAVYRMEYQHWTNAEAIAELRACGYRDLDDEWDLLDYLESYVPRWQRSAKTQAAVSGFERQNGVER